MIISSTAPVASGSKFTAQMTVELSSLESALTRAYGEPVISLSGDIPFTPDVPPAPATEIDLDTEVDVGSPATPGTVTANSGADALVITASGAFPTSPTTNDGFFNGAAEVVGDFEMVCRILYVDDGIVDEADPSALNGFHVGLGLFDGSDADDPAVLLGWGSHLSALRVQLLQRTAKAGALALTNSAVAPSPIGYAFKLRREAATLQASYSTNNMVSWTSLGSIALTKQTYRVGLFCNGGEAAGPAYPEITAVIADAQLISLPADPTDEFTITGARNALLRSNSPHSFTLDGNVDPEARAKVAGWVAEVKTRMTSAITALRAAYPAHPDGIDMIQV